jgi:hypothetical protein
VSFWDDPQHWPGDGSWPRTPGEEVEGTITRMAVMMGRFARLSLCVELDGDGRQRWANARLWRAIGELRAEVGDRIRVTRGADDSTVQPGASGKLPSTWKVERLPARPAAGAQPVGYWGDGQAAGATGQTGPTW